jgi:hypothetical protein
MTLPVPRSPRTAGVPARVVGSRRIGGYRSRYMDILKAAVKENHR